MGVSEIIFLILMFVVLIGTILHGNVFRYKYLSKHHSYFIEKVETCGNIKYIPRELRKTIFGIKFNFTYFNNYNVGFISMGEAARFIDVYENELLEIECKKNSTKTRIPYIPNLFKD